MLQEGFRSRRAVVVQKCLVRFVDTPGEVKGYKLLHGVDDKEYAGCLWQCLIIHMWLVLTLFALTERLSGMWTRGHKILIHEVQISPPHMYIPEWNTVSTVPHVGQIVDSY